MGATYYFDPVGDVKIGIASSEPGPYIRPEVRPKLYKWEKIAPGFGDAEEKLFNTFYGEGAGAGRKVCIRCQKILDGAGVEVLSPRRTTYRR
jgi:hypothetical protein